MEITTIHLDMVQSVALAIVSYYIGMWIKSHSAALQRFSIPAPVKIGLDNDTFENTRKSMFFEQRTSRYCTKN